MSRRLLEVRFRSAPNTTFSSNEPQPSVCTSLLTRGGCFYDTAIRNGDMLYTRLLYTMKFTALSQQMLSGSAVVDWEKNQEVRLGHAQHGCSEILDFTTELWCFRAIPTSKFRVLDLTSAHPVRGVSQQSYALKLIQTNHQTRTNQYFQNLIRFGYAGSWYVQAN